MKYNGISLAGFKGGLEYDIEQIYGDVSWEYLNSSKNYSRKIFRLSQILFLLLKKRRSHTILSCGGPVELIAGLIYAIICKPIIYTPGTPKKYYTAIKLLFKLTGKSVKLYTCDVDFFNEFKFSNIYNNNPFKNIKNNILNELELSKCYDGVLIGRADHNKRFQDFINCLGVYVDKIKINVKIIHLGQGDLYSSSKYIKLIQAGYLDDSDSINNIIKKSRMLCITSIYESSPRVFWESTFHGTPVISTYCGNVKYYPKSMCFESLNDLCKVFVKMIQMDSLILRNIAIEQYIEAENFMSKISC